MRFGVQRRDAAPGKRGGSRGRGVPRRPASLFRGRVGPDGIQANSVVPAIRTPMPLEAAYAPSPGMTVRPASEPKLRMVPVPASAFLAGDGARFITGQIIAVNGGLGMVR